MKPEYKSKKDNDLLRAQQIARSIKILSGVDVFENTRKKDIVEFRSLLVYILREVQDMTYHNIKDFFINNGKDYDHTTALHAYRNYDMYAKDNKSLEVIFSEIVSVAESENAKKLVAKSIIDNSSVEVAEVFTYMATR